MSREGSEKLFSDDDDDTDDYQPQQQQQPDAAHFVPSAPASPSPPAAASPSPAAAASVPQPFFSPFVAFKNDDVPLSCMISIDKRRRGGGEQHAAWTSSTNFLSLKDLMTQTAMVVSEVVSSSSSCAQQQQNQQDQHQQQQQQQQQAAATIRYHELVLVGSFHESHEPWEPRPPFCGSHSSEKNLPPLSSSLMQLRDSLTRPAGGILPFVRFDSAANDDAADPDREPSSPSAFSSALLFRDSFLFHQQRLFNNDNNNNNNNNNNIDYENDSGSDYDRALSSSPGLSVGSASVSEPNESSDEGEETAKQRNDFTAKDAKMMIDFLAFSDEDDDELDALCEAEQRKIDSKKMKKRSDRRRMKQQNDSHNNNEFDDDDDDDDDDDENQIITAAMKKRLDRAQRYFTGKDQQQEQNDDDDSSIDGGGGGGGGRRRQRAKRVDIHNDTARFAACRREGNFIQFVQGPFVNCDSLLVHPAPRREWAVLLGTPSASGRFLHDLTFQPDGPAEYDDEIETNQIFNNDIKDNHPNDEQKPDDGGDGEGQNQNNNNNDKTNSGGGGKKKTTTSKATKHTITNFSSWDHFAELLSEPVVSESSRFGFELPQQPPSRAAASRAQAAEFLRVRSAAALSWADAVTTGGGGGGGGRRGGAAATMAAVSRDAAAAAAAAAVAVAGGGARSTAANNNNGKSNSANRQGTAKKNPQQEQQRNNDKKEEIDEDDMTLAQLMETSPPAAPKSKKKPTPKAKTSAKPSVKSSSPSTAAKSEFQLKREKQRQEEIENEQSWDSTLSYIDSFVHRETTAATTATTAAANAAANEPINNNNKKSRTSNTTTTEAAAQRPAPAAPQRSALPPSDEVKVFSRSIVQDESRAALRAREQQLQQQVAQRGTGKVPLQRTANGQFHLNELHMRAVREFIDTFNRRADINRTLTSADVATALLLEVFDLSSAEDSMTWHGLLRDFIDRAREPQQQQNQQQNQQQQNQQPQNQNQSESYPSWVQRLDCNDAVKLWIHTQQFDGLAEFMETTDEEIVEMNPPLAIRRHVRRLLQGARQ